jgi:hypothetical protein
MGAEAHDLSPLQRDILEAFFGKEKAFFLTGGAALVGFYLHHRETTDLDLFAVEEAAFERGPHVVSDVAATLSAGFQVRQDAPGFKRFALGSPDNVVVVDLVLDRVPQIHAVKPEVRGIRLDPLEEILVNKITTVVSRTEERDLVDLYCLERAGYPIEQGLSGALAKDGGCTPATIAWLLSEMRIPDDARLSGGIVGAEIREWVAQLVKRLRRAAAPNTSTT